MCPTFEMSRAGGMNQTIMNILALDWGLIPLPDARTKGGAEVNTEPASSYLEGGLGTFAMTCARASLIGSFRFLGSLPPL